MLRAPSVGRYTSTRVDEGRKSGNLLAKKNARGQKSLLCEPGSELRLGTRERKKGEDIKSDRKTPAQKSPVLSTEPGKILILRGLVVTALSSLLLYNFPTHAYE